MKGIRILKKLNIPGQFSLNTLIWNIGAPKWK
jgi:hypothetical protein